MEPPVEAQTTEPQTQTGLGDSAFEERFSFTEGWIDTAYDEDLLTTSGVDPIVSTTQAAEYFDKTSQWILWGLKPDPKTGEIRFTWPDGTPIVPDRVGDPVRGRRRFTLPIVRAILESCYRRGNITQEQLVTVIRRLRYSELGVEWRAKEGWVYADLGKGRYRWVRPDDAEQDDAGVWRLRKVE